MTRHLLPLILVQLYFGHIGIPHSEYTGKRESLHHLSKHEYQCTQHLTTKATNLKQKSTVTRFLFSYIPPCHPESKPVNVFTTTEHPISRGLAPPNYLHLIIIGIGDSINVNVRKFFFDLLTSSVVVAVSSVVTRVDKDLSTRMM